MTTNTTVQASNPGCVGWCFRSKYVPTVMNAARAAARARSTTRLVRDGDVDVDLG